MSVDFTTINLNTTIQKVSNKKLQEIYVSFGKLFINFYHIFSKKKV